jgi:hypothetical protein
VIRNTELLPPQAEEIENEVLLSVTEEGELIEKDDKDETPE